MNRKPLVSALVALSLIASGGVFAQPDRNDRGRSGGDQRSHQGNNPRNDPRNSNNPRNDPRGGQQDWQGQRGAGPDNQYHRGQRYPSEYRGHQYVVDDWRGHNLRQPPRGYHWVQSGGDYLLVAITTGVILDLLLNN